MPAADFIAYLASRGRHHFTTEDAARALGSSLVATRAALRRLKGKGVIATPHRGFHVIVPPEYRALGCLPAEQFVPQLMEHLKLACYAGLLTAARYHGAAHQQPQMFQVMVEKSRLPIACGRVRVGFVARRNAGEMPTRAFNTPRGPIAVSTPETTAFDLVGYAGHCGGLDHVATVLAELAEVLDADRLAEVAPLSPTPWSQRLGFLLELVGAARLTDALAAHVRSRVTETALLSVAHEVEGAGRDRRWKLAVNCAVEPEA